MLSSWASLHQAMMMLATGEHERPSEVYQRLGHEPRPHHVNDMYE